jgi:hypothetical protein
MASVQQFKNNNLARLYGWPANEIKIRETNYDRLTW